MKKHTCPHCGEATFTPMQKALAGSMRTNGKPCPKCGRKCCNGMGSIYFSSAVWGIAFAAILVIYFSAAERIYSSILIGGILVASWVLCFLFDMFFGKLVQPIRVMN